MRRQEKNEDMIDYSEIIHSPPGVQIYFNIRESLQDLTDEEYRPFVESILDYGQYGLIPDLQDRALKAMWRDIKPRIDHDRMKYNKKCIDNSYKAYQRWCKDKEKQELDLESWYYKIHLKESTENDTNGHPRNTAGCYGIPNTNSDSNSNINSDSDSEPKAKGYGEREPEPATGLQQAIASSGNVDEEIMKWQQRYRAACKKEDVKAMKNAEEQIKRLMEEKPF